MSKFYNLLIVFVLGLALTACTSEKIKTKNNVITEVQHGVDMDTAMHEFVKNHDEINWVTLENIKKSLKGVKPMNVSFDFDDTLFFSSPVFWHGQQKYSPHKFGYLKKQAFWNEANGGEDEFSIPKKSAIELVKFHHARGDKIYVITGRTGPKHKDYGLKLLNKVFGKNVFTKVIYAGGHKKSPAGSRKTAFIKKYNISLHYGDADEDIFAPHELNIRAIRFIRSSSTTYYPLPKIGKYGEEVLVGSEK